MNIEEVEEPEATKIHMQNLFPPLADTWKARKLPQKTNIEARWYDIYDEIRSPPPIEHPGLLLLP